jgi:ubiquitin C-terminal hydrolase
MLISRGDPQRDKENNINSSRLGSGYSGGNPQYDPYSRSQVVITPFSSSTKGSVHKKLIGLDNLGNTCYMNTSLQCLIHTEPFINRLMNEKGIKLKRVALALYEVLEEIMTKSDNTKSSVKPSNFKSIFGMVHSMYAGYSQQDSQEFLRKLLEDIAKELNRVTSVPAYKELDTRSNDKRKINNDFDRLFKSREDSIVGDTFYGQLVNIFTCQDCKHETYSFEKFMDIPLLLNDENSTNLDTLLNKHFEQEGFKWDTPCEKCKRKSFHAKNAKISSLPEVLMLSFQRYNNRYGKKNTAKVSFKESIDIRDYIDTSCVGYTNTKYTLYAISNHSGSMDFGHYYA